MVKLFNMQNENEKLAEIESTLKEIYKIMKPSRWQMLVEGLWRGVGYLIGVLLAVAILGWVLNVIGVIPFLSDFSSDMKEVLKTTKVNR